MSSIERFSTANLPADPNADAWRNLSRFTNARIALGRSGGSLRTGAQLNFRLSHARARDAIWSRFDAEALATSFREKRLATEILATMAGDRPTYLARPDFGRVLEPRARERLQEKAISWGRRDLVILVSDGLSPEAAMNHALDTILPVTDALGADGWTVFPIIIVPFARVKLQDEVGELLGARHALMLLGERPGLGAPDSLGAYFTYRPSGDRTDADRNCVSNIRPAGFAPKAAARKLAQWLLESARRQMSGTGLKDLEPREMLP